MSKAEKSGNWFKRHKILTGVLAFIILCLIVSAAGGNKKDTSNTKPSATTQAINKPATTAPTPKRLAMQVEAAYLKHIGYSSITELNQDKNDVVGSLENKITNFEDENSGVVKVNVQDSLTSAKAKQIGQDVMIGAGDIKSLQWVDVRGTNGTTSEVSRQNAGLAN